MPGSFRLRGCTCGKKRCVCGAKWYYRYSITDPVTGKRKQKEVGGFILKSEAVAASVQIQADLQTGTFVEEQNITFEKFAEEWKEYYASTGKVKISTVDVRQKEMKRIKSYMGGIKIKNITRKQYQDMLNDLKAKGLADNTIAGIHTTGRMIFKRAIELAIIKNNPTTHATLPKTQPTVEELEAKNELPKYLEKEELAFFLKTARCYGLDRDYAIFLTFAYTGLRLGELCALKWSDIDFIEQTISVTKTYYNPTNKINAFKLLTPKTKSSRRVIDVDQLVLDELKNLRHEQNKLKILHANTYYEKEQGFVFAQQKVNIGYPPHEKLISYRMKRLLKIAKLNFNLTPHSLRHTHTSLMAEAEVSLEQIMSRLGHSNDNVTRNIYLHITKPRKKEASQKFAELMKSLKFTN